MAQGKNLAWFVTEERLLTLELAMLKDHGLTLHLETQSFTGLRMAAAFSLVSTPKEGSKGHPAQHLSESDGPSRSTRHRNI